MRVMVVDDEPEIREVISARLELHDHDVVTAEGGTEAFDLIQTEPGSIDLIISDIRMPKGTGIELLDSLNTIDTRPPVLIFSGFTDISEEEILAKGALALLEKPVDFERIIDIIESLE